VPIVSRYNEGIRNVALNNFSMLTLAITFRRSAATLRLVRRPAGWTGFLDKERVEHRNRAYLLKRSRYPAGLRQSSRDSLNSFNIDIGFIEE
jgi:hypothetical protein